MWMARISWQLPSSSGPDATFYWQYLTTLLHLLIGGQRDLGRTEGWWRKTGSLSAPQEAVDVTAQMSSSLYKYWLSVCHAQVQGTWCGWNHHSSCPHRVHSTVREKAGHWWKYSTYGKCNSREVWSAMKAHTTVPESNLGEGVIKEGFLKEAMSQLRLEGQELAKEEEVRKKRRKNGSR